MRQLCVDTIDGRLTGYRNYLGVSRTHCGIVLGDRAYTLQYCSFWVIEKCEIKRLCGYCVEGISIRQLMRRYQRYSELTPIVTWWIGQEQTADQKRISFALVGEHMVYALDEALRKRQYPSYALNSPTMEELDELLTLVGENQTTQLTKRRVS